MDYEKLWKDLREYYLNFVKRGVKSIHPITVADSMDFIEKGIELYGQGRKDEREYIEGQLPEDLKGL